MLFEWVPRHYDFGGPANDSVAGSPSPASFSFLMRRAAIPLIVFFSLLVHLPGLTSPFLDYHAHRQCQTASMARNYARHGMHVLNPEIDTDGFPQRAGTEFPLYSYLLAILFKWGGIRDVWGRLLSSAFAALGAVFLFWFVERRLDEKTALAAALVMCVIPVHIYFTRTVQPEPMALAGLLGFVYFLDRFIDGESGGSAAAAMLLGALSPLVKLPFFYIVFPLWLYLGWEKKAWKRIGYWSVMAGILIATEAWYNYAKTAPVLLLPLSPQEHLANLRPIATLDLWQAHFISRFPELDTTYSGLLFAIVGWTALCGRDAARIFKVWAAATAVYIVLLGKYGLIHRYTELPWAPVTAVFIAAGILQWWEKARGRTAWKATVAILVIGIPLHAALRIKHWYRLERLWLYRAQPVVARLTRPEDLILTNTAEHPVLLYYLDRYGFAKDFDEATPTDVELFKRRGAAYFLTPVEGSWTRHPEWAAYFAAHARLIHQDLEFLLYKLK